MFRELSTQYDCRKSFNGKATVRTSGKQLVLRSYQTDVAYIEDGKLIVNGTYSATTLRHIKEFARQNGFDAPGKKYIEENYIRKTVPAV